MPKPPSKYLLWIPAVVVAGFLMWYFSNIVGYILVSAVLAIVGRPLVDLLRSVKIFTRRMPRWAAAAVTLMAIWAAMIVFFYLIIPLVFSKVSEFSSLDLQRMVYAFREPLAVFQNFLEHTFSIRSSDFSLADSLTRNLNEFLNIGKINNLVTSAVTTVGRLAVALFSVSFITFFFLKEEKLFVNMVVAVFPDRYESNIEHAMSSVNSLLKRYFTGILIESTIITLLVAGALMLWGMGPSNAFFIGFLMGLLNVIPYIGPLIGAALSVFISVLDPVAGFGAMQMVMLIGGVILSVKALDDFILQPVLYSNSVKAHPLEIFLVILIAGSTAGVPGMLLAIPTYNVLRVFAKEFFNKFRLVQKLTDKI
jgi:predicted PurR-regulated permease PerM